MRATDRTEREALNDAGFKVRLAAQELKSQGVDPDGKVSRDLFMATLDLIKEELGKLGQRLAAIEKRIDSMDDRMRYCGEWLPNFEYDPGNVVEYAGAMHVAVKPRDPKEPPSRFTGWAALPIGG